MWFLENAWLVPLIPAVSFVLILLFGKRMPKQGLRGRHPRGRCVVRAVVSAPRIGGSTASTTPRARKASTRSAWSSALGRSVGRFSQEEGHAVLEVEPITRSITWFQNGGVKLGAGIQIDGLAVMMMFVVTLDLAARAHLLDRVHAGRPALHALLRRR